MSAAGKSDNGMTLLETLVVLAILGFVGSLCVLQINRSLHIYTLREAASTIEADIRTARAQALRSGQPVSFAASDNGATYGWSDGTVRSLSAGVGISQSQPIVFYPDGSTSGGTIVVADARAQQRFTVDPATGAMASP